MGKHACSLQQGHGTSFFCSVDGAVLQVRNQAAYQNLLGTLLIPAPYASTISVKNVPDRFRLLLPAFRTVPDALLPFLLLLVELALAARRAAGVLVLLAGAAGGAVEAAEFLR